MVNNNMVSQVLVHKKYLNNNITNIETTNYSTWTGNSVTPQFLLPQSTLSQNGYAAPYTTMTIGNYDSHGNVLQVNPVDGISKNYIWDYNNATRPVAEIVNAGNQSFAYTSFEASGNGNWTISSATRNGAGFTGIQSYPLTSNNLSISGLTTSATYSVSLWAQSGATIYFNGAAATSTDSRLGWNFYQVTLTGVSSLTITGTGNVDEVRLCPSGATMTTMAHGPYGIVSSTDPNNVTTFYQYDGMGRLAVVRDDKNKILKTVKYNYQN
jgi:YD repeat-containing protein